MRFSYNKLFKLLIDRGINKKTLREMSGISATSVAKLGKGGNVNTDVLLRICHTAHLPSSRIYVLILPLFIIFVTRVFLSGFVKSVFCKKFWQNS